MRTHNRILQALLVGALASGAAAQNDAWSSLEAVDAGTEDVSLLGESLRLVPIDMRVSDSFSSIFRLDGIDGWEDQFARREGALTAVFPQSVYYPTQSGVEIAIPAGTVFLIGAPPEWMFARYDLAQDVPTQEAGPTALPDLRIGTGLGSEAVDTRAPVTQTVLASPERDLRQVEHRRPPMPWRTDHRRAERVSSLLSLAVAGE